MIAVQTKLPLGEPQPPAEVSASERRPSELASSALTPLGIEQRSASAGPTIEGYRPTDSTDRNRIKDRAMRYLRTNSTRHGARVCMIEPREGVVRIRVDSEGRGHVSGLKRCASPWACPTCSFKVRQRRADELTRLVEAVQAQGGDALLITATIPHDAGQGLREVLDQVQAAWKALWSGRWAKSLREAYGITGSCRAIEITYGTATGWHPHIHALVTLDHKTDSTELVELWGALMLRYQRIAEGIAGRPVNLARALDVRPVEDPRNVCEYVVDAGSWSVGAELAAGPVKLGKSSGRWSPFALLAAVTEWGDADAARLWHEYEEVTRGRRAIFASHGLMDRYGVDEATDADAAEGPQAAEVVAEVELDPLWWAALGAVDAQRAYVTAVEVWAVAGASGAPPDPIEQLALALEGFA